MVKMRCLFQGSPGIRSSHGMAQFVSRTVNRPVNRFCKTTNWFSCVIKGSEAVVIRFVKYTIPLIPYTKMAPNSMATVRPSQLWLWMSVTSFKSLHWKDALLLEKLRLTPSSLASVRSASVRLLKLKSTSVRSASRKVARERFAPRIRAPRRLASLKLVSLRLEKLRLASCKSIPLKSNPREFVPTILSGRFFACGVSAVICCFRISPRKLPESFLNFREV